MRTPLLFALAVLTIAAPCFGVRCETRLLSSAAAEDPALALLQATRHALEARLDIDRDPFAWASSNDAGRAIWARLRRAFPPLNEVCDAVSQAYREGAAVPEAVEQRALRAADELLATPGKDRDPMAGAVKALLRLEEIRARDLAPQNPAPPAPEQKKEEKKKDEKEEKPKTPPPDPEYPDAMKNYQARNKDSEGEAMSGPRTAIASVNKEGVGYFRMAVFQVVDALTNRWAQTAVTEPIHLVTQLYSSYFLKVKPLTKKGEVLPVLVPQGFTPRPFKDADSEVFLDETGNYFYRTSLDELKIGLVPQGAATRPLSAPERDTYTAPSPVPLSAWPDHLRTAVERLQAAREDGIFSGPDGDLKLARVLGSYIANHFKYRVDADEEESALTLAAKGAFQCDTATTILVTLLRSEFQIPCRAVGGFRGNRNPYEPGSSFVLHPSDGHAWTEVADQNGDWHGVDPTPKEKDRETKNDSDKEDDFEPISEEGSSGEAGDQEGKEDASGADGVPKDNAGDAGKTLGELIREVEQMQKARAQAREASRKEGAKGSGEGKGQGDSEGNGERATGVESGIAENREGNDRADRILEELEEKNPFIRRTVTRMMAMALDPKLTSVEKMDRIQFLKTVVGRDVDKQFPLLQRMKGLLSDATMLFTGDHAAFDKELEGIFSKKLELNKIVDRLAHIQRQVEFSLPFFDEIEKKPLQLLLREIRDIRRALSSIKHKDAEAIRIAIELDENLPGNISRQVIRNAYGVGSKLGDDVGTLALAEAIGQGKLNDHRLASILGPHTDFLVRPIQKSSTGYRKTWVHDISRRSRPEIQLTRDPRMRFRVRLYEHLSDEEALKRGEMGVLVNPKRVPFQEGSRNTNPKKRIYIAADTSGSMAGQNALFQSMYISALVDRALSEVGEDGESVNEVYILPFDSVVHDEVEVKSAKEAYAFVSDALRKTKNSGGGTDIQAALLAIAEKVKTANEKSGIPYSRGTAIVCSDGQSNVVEATVRKAFQDIGPQTEILLAFVAIGGTNAELQALTNQDLGADRSMYIEWNDSDISRVMADARAPAKAVNDFWTKYSWNNLPPELTSTFERLKKSMGDYRSLTSLSDSHKRTWGAITHALDKEHRLPVTTRVERRAGGRYGTLSSYRRFLSEIGGCFTKDQRRKLLDEVLVQWKSFVPESMSELDYKEIAALRYVFLWVETGIAGEVQ